MAMSQIPVDLRNLGQVYACLGLQELAEILIGPAEGCFVAPRQNAKAQFHLRVVGKELPSETALDFLSEAKIFSEAPYGWLANNEWKSGWGELHERLPGDLRYPYPPPRSAFDLVTVIEHNKKRAEISYWGSIGARDNMKFRPGAYGIPAAALIVAALNGRAIDNPTLTVREACTRGGGDPFSVGAPQTNGLRLDYRRDAVALNEGFSINKHEHITAVGYPIVEVLAAVGLTHARPKQCGNLDYRYTVPVSDEPVWYTTSLLRSALSLALHFDSRTFAVKMGWSSQPGKDRAITSIMEMNQ